MPLLQDNRQYHYLALAFHQEVILMPNVHFLLSIAKNSEIVS
jgi:hypothetical protein